VLAAAKNPERMDDLIVFRRIAVFEIGRAEVSQKYVTTSDHPLSRGTLLAMTSKKNGHPAKHK